ncbi:MAG: CRISPR-associated protein Cas4, partial [Deltaproteobacteria bacterium]|nr:CRISPR-associated protein Cas4 [Deltaproteobacteria bacterium]
MRCSEDGEYELMAASALNAWTYCPRLAVLQYRDGESHPDAAMQDGLRAHTRVDEERGQWPLSEDIEGREVARSLWLSAYDEGITARLDLVEATGVGEAVRPVDYKRGDLPDTPEGAWPPERVQVCAQALVLRENGYEVHEGALWFAAARRRVRVVLDDTLIATTRAAVRDLRAALVAESTPPPLRDSPKCNGCSLGPICL